jgi:hypothetical protein
LYQYFVCIFWCAVGNQNNNTISDNLIWYKLYIDGIYKELLCIDYIPNGNYIAIIKKQVKKEHSSILENIELSNIHIFSGIAHESELENSVLWHREFHGGGTENPLIVVATTKKQRSDTDQQVDRKFPPSTVDELQTYFSNHDIVVFMREYLKFNNNYDMMIDFMKITYIHSMEDKYEIGSLYGYDAWEDLIGTSNTTFDKKQAIIYIKAFVKYVQTYHPEIDLKAKDEDSIKTRQYSNIVKTHTFQQNSLLRLIQSEANLYERYGKDKEYADVDTKPSGGTLSCV